LPDGARARPRLVMAVLSSPSEASRHRRCFQRAVVLALASARHTHGWMALHNGGALLLRYVISPPNRRVDRDELQHESRMHRDIWNSTFEERPSTCFSKIVYVFRRVAASSIRPDFVMIGDDDVWIHPPRLLQDLTPLSTTVPLDTVSASQSSHEVIYGLVAFNAGWNREASREYGNGVYNADAAALVRGWKLRRRRTRLRQDDGPFPFAYGFCMIVSFGLAEVVDRPSPTSVCHTSYTSTSSQPTC
jgi:hypothetical protein